MRTRVVRQAARPVVRCGLLHDCLLGGQPLGVGGGGGLLEQSGLDRLLGAHVAALAHACALAHALAQVVELGAANIAARGDLHALDLGRMQGKRALHAHAEGLLAHGEGLARAVALALDHDALEHLHAAARALDDLEVDLDPVSRREAGNTAQLLALDAVDDAAHSWKEGALREGPQSAGARGRRGPS